MKSLWEKGQFPMLSPSLPAWEREINIGEGQGGDTQNNTPFSDLYARV